MPVQMQLENSTGVDVLLQVPISRVGASKDALTSFQKFSNIVLSLWEDHKQKRWPQTEKQGISVNLQNILIYFNATVNDYGHWANIYTEKSQMVALLLSYASF